MISYHESAHSPNLHILVFTSHRLSKNRSTNQPYLPNRKVMTDIQERILCTEVKIQELEGEFNYMPESDDDINILPVFLNRLYDDIVNPVNHIIESEGFQALDEESKERVSTVVARIKRLHGLIQERQKDLSKQVLLTLGLLGATIATIAALLNGVVRAYAT
ncbi:hypothetical protein NHQ30_011668 [Ciborinia camelliae]|nr:hypothetical protein NHQ30_011668 [Ciborinia camelliae]